MPSGGVRGFIDAEASDVSGVTPRRKQVSNGFEPERPWLAITRTTRHGCPPPGPASPARPPADSPLTGPVGRSASMWPNHRQRLNQRPRLDFHGRCRSRQTAPDLESATDPATERRCTYGNSPAHPRTRRRLLLRVSSPRPRPCETRPDAGAFQQPPRMACFTAGTSRPAPDALFPAPFDPRQRSARPSTGPAHAASCSPSTHFGKDRK